MYKDVHEGNVLLTYPSFESKYFFQNLSYIFLKLSCPSGEMFQPVRFLPFFAHKSVQDKSEFS
jgi:hypothetical protein